MSSTKKSYTEKDFDLILTELKNKIVHYLPEWTDHNDSDFGIALLQLFSHVGDILHYYLERMVGEAFLPTVTERGNLINLLKLIDYELSGAAPSSADLTFTLSRSYGEAVTIPAGTECQSVADEALGIESFYFETDADLELLTGELSGTVGATEGKSGSETLGTSDETAYQKFDIAAGPVIDGTLKVFVDAEQWAEVDTLGLSEPDAKEYYIQRDADEKITVFFGDNSQGLVPGNGSVITATYRVGGGSKGNVGPDTITIINSCYANFI